MSQRQMIQWDIRRQRREWTDADFDARLAWAPEKIEFVGGIFDGDDERMIVLGMLLENLGLDAAVTGLGRLEDWEAAIAARRQAEAKDGGDSA